MFPSALIKSPNPVFDQELPRIRWLSTPDRLKWYTINILVSALTVAVIMLIWLVGQEQTVFSNYSTASLLWLYALFPVIRGVVGLVADVYYITTPMLAITREVEDGKWDVLRLTPLGEEQLIAAKYAIAQTRVWRLMVIDMGLRIIISAFSFGTLSMLSISNDARGLVVVSLLTFVVSASFGFFDTLWRMKAIVALGLAIPFRSRRSDMVYAFLVLGGLWLVQAIISAVVSYLGFIASFFLLESSTVASATPSFSAYALFSAVIIPLGTLGLNYVLYRILRAGALRDALRLSRA